jgi:outer membrane protein OmpA-like peptidoglycan-associated protein
MSMRHSLSVIAVLLVLAVPARAQVTVDLKALDAVPPAPSAQTPPPKAATSKPHAKPQAVAPKAATPKAATQASRPPAPPPSTTTAPAAAQAPSMRTPPPLPVAPPPSVALAPIPPPPTLAPAAPLPPAPVSASVTGAAVPVAGGLRIGFGPGQGELSQSSDQTLQSFVHSLPLSEAISYNVVAYAAGTPEDPSTARRVSLARALSVRGVLMGAGVPSSRIYVRALGATGGNGPADRVDVTALGVNAPPPSPEPPSLTPKQP